MKELNLKELRNYRGTGDRPKDFDIFWDARIEMLDKLPLEVTIIPALDLEFEHFIVSALYFKSFDGARIHAKYIRPKTESAVPCVLQFHGYPGSSRPYFEHTSFVEAGMAVLAMDCRGQGGLSEDIGGIQGTTVSGHLIAGMDDRLDNMLYVKIYSDVYLLSRIALSLSELNPNEVYVNGASQGAALASVCAALNPKIKKAAILYPFLSDFERVFDLGFDLVAYEGLRYYSRWFDPEGQNRKQMFERLAYIDVRNFASRIQSEVLFGISMADTVCPISTQYAVYNNLKCEKQLHRYPGKGHEPIHAFDDLILSFFDKKNVKSRLVYEDDAMCFQSIGEESANLIIQFQPSIAYGKHHLRRYLSLGYEVLTVSTKLNLDLSLIKNVISRLTKIKKDHEHKRIVLVAEDVQARIALYASMKLSNVYAMILQTPVGFTSKDVNYAHKIDANILLGLGGLDDEKNMKMNQAFYANLKARNQIIQYPKYGRERINAFEDQKLKFIELEKKRF